MNTNRGTRYEIKTCDQLRKPRNTTSQNFIGGAALASIALACAWTFYTNVFGAAVAPVNPSVTTNRTASADSSSFAERFAAVPAAPHATLKKQNRYIALLDPSYSLGPPPEAFSSAPRNFDRRLVALAPSRSSEPDLDIVAALPPAAAQIVPGIPLPVSRPAELRSFASREIAKAKAAILRSEDVV